MKVKLISTFAAGLVTLFSHTLSAEQIDCGVDVGNVSILSNDFPALHAVAAMAERCATDRVVVTKNQSKDHRDIQSAALKAKPSKYSTAIVSTSSIVPLLNEGLIQPLDALVAKHGQSLQPTQLIKIDGSVMAVAFMANSQHLFYRKDMLEKVGAQPPKTYDELIATAKKIQKDGLMKYPIALNTKTGWNLGEEFINVFSATGAGFFKPGSAIPNLNNAEGIKALNTLKALTELSNPDFLTFDSNSTQALWEEGKVAFALMWGSRGTAILDDEGSTPEIVGSTVLTNTPAFTADGTPGATLWWDGWTIASNLSEQDAEATFKVMVQAISPDMMKVNSQKAVWLIEGYEPDASAMGVISTVQQQANPYPMLPYMGLLHSALGAELPDFLLGNESAAQALKDVEDAYMTSAREQGFL
ncbi:sugar ABC transporter substrate-binding protein [Enterovibrio norvegicus]|uniref:ABC transporter substrate-binding protein n=1 Tax=Enterovibrio norvegicus TaxID=188144 RepID=UPI00030E8B78|nr:extracellular solute-binding protein [Enterovibrio norvegicus]OEF48404.1 sugar ABC transporter substrate-binding protein [Enterovibrio norvegicus]